ncbi:DMT family transporter [Anaeromicrobium sediminis]|nr:DMT family transporter [Anaeromicrobium sediminis]
MYLILALIGGSLIVISMTINSKLSQRIGVPQGAFINNIVASIVILTFLLMNRENFVSMEKLINVPLWVYMGGILSIFVVSCSNIIISKIPAIYTTLLLFIGQLFMGIIIDYMVGNMASMGKILGGVLIIIGLAYNFSIDRKSFMVKEECN